MLEELRREPAWSEQDHPDLMTIEDVDRYVRRLRETWVPRSWDETDEETKRGKTGQNQGNHSPRCHSEPKAKNFQVSVSG